MNGINFSDYSHKKCLKNTQIPVKIITFTGIKSKKLKSAFESNQIALLNKGEKTLKSFCLFALPGGVVFLPSLWSDTKELIAKSKTMMNLSSELPKDLQPLYERFKRKKINHLLNLKKEFVQTCAEKIKKNEKLYFSELPNELQNLFKAAKSKSTNIFNFHK